jgi:A/G-specific adenine glycosylase
MLGWPGTEWAETAPEEAPPLPADWQDAGAEARHTFTHFHLRLALRVALIDPAELPADTALSVLPRSAFRPSDLPTVMRKAFDLAQGRADSLAHTRPLSETE